MTLRPTRWYRPASVRTRLHVAARWATGPFGALDGLLPRAGTILDWGTGHGLLALALVEHAPGRTVHGVDIDAAKVEVARAIATTTPFWERLSFAVVDPDAIPEPGPDDGPEGTGGWNAIVICDVLYLLEPAHQRAVVEGAARSLAPGGVLVVKETGPDPHWKAELSRMQEQVSVRAARITASESGVHGAAAPDELASWLEPTGLDVRQYRLDRGYHTPHTAVVGRRPSVDSAAAEPDGRLPL